MTNTRRIRPYYSTDLGDCYWIDSLELLRSMPGSSVNLILTSPPFALRRKKEYGNVEAQRYVDWFMPFAREFHRVLTDDGSLVIDIGGSWTKGLPTRSIYHFKLLVALVDVFHLAQEFYWYNTARLPSPAEWVTVRRIRVKDAVDPVWWLSKTPFPKSDNRRVLKPYSDSMLVLLQNGYKAKLRPSGHDISEGFNRDNGGAIPSNLIMIANTESNGRYLRSCRENGVKPHPARFPAALPEFFMKMLTDENDVVLDPFAGSNVTGEVAERNARRWISAENVEDYVQGSMYRFDSVQFNRIRVQLREGIPHVLMDGPRETYSTARE